MRTNAYAQSSPAFVFFDEGVSNTAQSLELMLGATARYTQENVPVLLMCEAYCNARQHILEAGHWAARGEGKKALAIFDELYEAHRKEIEPLITKTQEIKSSATKIMQTCMQTTHENMRLLLVGVTRLKELSPKTSALLMDMSSALAAYTVALYLQLKTNSCVRIVQALEAVPEKFETAQVYVVLARNGERTQQGEVAMHNSADALAAAYAKKAGARVVDIWTHTHGVMTANTAYVENARAVRTLSYEMALEIAMLGGKVFHPLALQMLMKDEIPLAIYSTANPAAYTTSIALTQENAHIPEVVITNQNSCSICTISSTDMFHRHGYLEKLFRICSQHHVSVETISTSEISVTISFFTRFCTKAFLADLRMLGDVRYADNYSLISLISSSVWNSPQKIASALSCIPPDVAIETLSLGNAELSFSFAVQSTHVQNVMQGIHDSLYSWATKLSLRGEYPPTPPCSKTLLCATRV